MIRPILLVCMFAIFSTNIVSAQSVNAFKPPYYIKWDPIAALLHGNQSIGLSFEKPYRDVSTWELDVNYVFNYLGANDNSSDVLELAPGRTSYKIALAKKVYFKGSITGFRYNWYQGVRLAYSNVSHKHIADCNGVLSATPLPNPLPNLPTDIIRKSRSTISYLLGYQKIKDRFIFDVYMANGITFVDYSAKEGVDLGFCNPGFSIFGNSNENDMSIYREGNDIRTKGSRVTYSPEFGLKLGFVIK
jgi:hypothetical protein